MKNPTIPKKEKIKKIVAKVTEKHPEVNPAMVVSAVEAGLHYVTDETLTISRMKKGKTFFFQDKDGKRVTDEATNARIRSLAIPPAYRDVKISPDPLGHLQAIGRDARNRKQYRYHPDWRQIRDANKYDKILSFGKALPTIRGESAKHLKQDGLPREKVLATVIQLLEKTLIRIGNEEYAKSNNSYGLTTLRNKHVEIRGTSIHFEFKGKSKIHHAIDLEDGRIAKIIKKCQDLPGHELFQYVDKEGTRHRVQSDDVNRYLKDITREEFTAKDFRTWAGTVLAASALSEMKKHTSESQAKKNINLAIESVSKKLGNTKAICRKCYVHPEVLSAYLTGDFYKLSGNLKDHEIAVMKLLKRRMKSIEAKR